MKKLKNIKITDVRMAVAKECLLYEDSSKELITALTKVYLRQLKKDDFEIKSWKYTNCPSENLNATKVQYFISKLKDERRANNTKKKLRDANKIASRSFSA